MARRSRRKEAFAQVPGGPLADAPRRGLAADRHPGPEALRLRPADALGSRPKPPWPALEPAWQALDAHYETGIAQVDGTLARVRRRSDTLPGGAVFLDLDRAVREHPELLDRHLLTQAVQADEDVFAALHGGVLDRRASCCTSRRA